MKKQQNCDTTTQIQEIQLSEAQFIEEDNSDC